ncbi:MAG: hypothetical protein LBJ72_00200 [Dysgonamonadaceae bacterium]|jgi:hypothetical protein|nr:hypothetical protein [Dysgonamonadaceae bacterium]
MELIRIKIKELAAFSKGELFQNFEIKPVSPLRIESYISNPRAKEEDPVLYILIENGKLIAFRTVLPDMIYDHKNTPLRFAWCSGVWSDPTFRGKKLWEPLLEAPLEDWNNKLLFTNYAPIIQALYTRNNLFKLAIPRQGYRFYFRPDFKELFKNRISNPVFKPLLSAANAIASLLYTLKSCFSTSLPDIKIEEIDYPDRDCIELLENYSGSSLFGRGEKEFNWIINQPWVMKEKDPSCRYPFSYDRIEYKIKIVKQFSQNIFSGFFIYSTINREMKVLYCFGKNDTETSATIPILQIAKTNNISHLTVLSSSISKAIRGKPGYYLFSKSYSSNIYSSFNFPHHDLSVFDGDGDNCFT